MLYIILSLSLLIIFVFFYKSEKMDALRIIEFSTFLNLIIVLLLVLVASRSVLFSKHSNCLLLGVVVLDVSLLGLIILLFYPRVDVMTESSKNNVAGKEESLIQEQKFCIWFRIYTRVNGINILSKHGRNVLKRNEKGYFLFGCLYDVPRGLTQEFLEKMAKLAVTSVLIYRKPISIFWFPEVFTIFVSITLLKGITGNNLIILFLFIIVSLIFIFKFDLVNKRFKKCYIFLDAFSSGNWFNLLSNDYKNYRSFLWIERKTLNQIISHGLEVNAWKIIGNFLPFRVR